MSPLPSHFLTHSDYCVSWLQIIFFLFLNLFTKNALAKYDLKPTQLLLERSYVLVPACPDSVLTLLTSTSDGESPCALTT